MIEWEDKFSVGISIINEQHKEFIDILNKVIYTKEHNDNIEEIDEVLEEMVNYAHTHFKIEESYMKLFNFPYYQDYEKEHHDFVIKTIAYHDKVIKGDSQVVNEILEYLKRWLVNHIQGTDKKFIDCCKENGLE